MEEKSTESIDNAMLMIKEISKKVVVNVEETPAEFRPSQVELTFNLLLTIRWESSYYQIGKGEKPESNANLEG